MSLHRSCCCGGDETCCALWCDCPDTIRVTICKRTRSGALYACDQGYPAVDCSQPDGTQIGACYSAVKLRNVKFNKVTSTSQSPDCNGCCRYVVATGESQTGTFEAWRDDYQLWCSEMDGDNCVRGNQSCEGYFAGPLSGSSGTWSLNEFSGFLEVQCCNGTCSDNSFVAVLNIHVQGGKTDAAEYTNCCDQTTTTTTLSAELSYDYTWECRHKSRWTDTCPCDLMQESGTETVYWNVTACFYNLCYPDTYPCPTVGQGADYAGPCIIDPPVIQYGSTLEDAVLCSVVGNNGSLEDIVCG